MENKGWWKFPRWSDEYERGVDEYIEKAFATRSQGDEISCPCTICHHRYWYSRSDIKDHIICNGFIPRMDEFSDLRASVDTEMEGLVNDEQEPLNMNDGVHELLDTIRDGPNEEVQKVYKLIEEGQEELFPGCKLIKV